MALDDVCIDLESKGYEVQAFIIPACGVEAHHRRDRCWIIAYLAYSSRERCRKEGQYIERPKERPASGGDVGYTEHNGSSTTEISNGVIEAGNNNPQESISPIKLEGAGRPSNSKAMADTISKRGCGWDSCGEYASDVRQSSRYSREYARGVEIWNPQPRLGRALNGLPDWMDGFEYIGNPDRFGIPRITTRKDDRKNRLKALGNSVVPQIPEIIGRAIIAVSAA